MNEPTLTRQLSGLSFSWPSLGITLALSRVRESGGETKAEIMASNGKGVLTQQFINLLAGRSRSQLARELERKHGMTSPNWETILETVCVLGLHELRKGEPVVILQPHNQPNVPFLLSPLVYQKHQTLIYAPGGSCKSYLALYLALLASHGAEQNGLRALRCPVLYLDWELDAETIGTRLRRLHLGHPELSQFAPYYRACNQPLHEEVEFITGEIHEKGIKLVIVDSAIMACGDDLNSTQAPKQLQRALRTMGCSSVVLSHVAKNTDAKTAYGNVFFQNLCRNQYEVELMDETDEQKRITLTHRKINFGALQQPTGLAFDFSGNACHVSTFDPQAEAEGHEDASLPIPSRIRNLLEDGVPRTAKEIATDLGEDHTTVRVTLNRHDRRKWSKLSDGKWSVISRK